MRYLLIAAACHVALTTTIFLIGHFQLLPGTFDQNGVGLTFAIDGSSYQTLASDMAGEWQANGLAGWLRVKAPLHCRLYSLSFAIFGKLLGHNILAAEPLNLFYYLGILGCVFLLGREVFDAGTGLLAASIVGAWPSFLLHSTQLLRDPLSILCLLALMVVLTLVAGRTLAAKHAVGIGIAGAVLVTLFWVTRGNMWNVVLAAVAITLVMLIYRMVRERRFMAGNALVMLLLIAAVLLAPARFESTALPGVKSPQTPLAFPSSAQPDRSERVWTRAIKQIAARRAAFGFSKSHTSNIDPEVRFNSTSDVLKFIPRAFVIGFFAPFPRMWIEAGSFGLAVRLLSGLETLAMYFLYVAVGLCIWQNRQNLKMWLLFLVAAVGMVGLGLVVVNAGALYRIRYAFWMMLLVPAARGVLDTIAGSMRSKKVT